MRDRQTCIDCGCQSPETDTNYTLISAQFGWRLARKRLADGTFVVEWRCADCWKTFKSTTAGSELAHEPITATRPVASAPVRRAVSSAPPGSGARAARNSSNAPRAVPPARPRSQPAPKSAGVPAVAVPRTPLKPSR